MLTSPQSYQYPPTSHFVQVCINKLQGFINPIPKRNKVAKGRTNNSPNFAKGGAMEIDKEMQHQKELKARRKAWEEQRQAEEEERARQEKQGRMQAFLASRRRAWVDHTGSLPPEEVTTSWRMEYLSERAAEEDAERALRLAEAEDVAAG